MKKILNVILTILLIGWCYLIITDYLKVGKGEKAEHCIKTEIYEYDDGSVEECVGLGYKVYYYDRPNVKIKQEFGPFWIKIKE